MNMMKHYIMWVKLTQDTQQVITDEENHIYYGVCVDRVVYTQPNMFTVLTELLTVTAYKYNGIYNQ